MQVFKGEYLGNGENSRRILQNIKGTIKLGRKDSKEENVLLIENMKYNLQSVSQMYD
jgi:hypothetical protein